MPEENSAEQTQSPEIVRRTSVKMASAEKAHADHPEENQDTALMINDNNSPLKLFSVLDGVGGLSGGKLASQTASETFSQKLKEAKVSPDISPENCTHLVKQLLLQAHEAVKNAREGKNSGMATTASVGLIWEDPKSGQRKLIVGNVGDSRIYLFRNGSITQLTQDDNLASIGRPNEITQALGEANIEPKVGIFDLQAGDRLVAVSDGIPDALEEDHDEIFKNSLDKDNSADQAARILVGKARRLSLQGRKMDDQTAVVVDIGAQQLNRSEQPKVPTLLGKKTVETLKEKPKNRIPLGTEVRMLRHNGKMETGWTLVMYNSNGSATALAPDGVTTKQIRREQLEELNPPIERTTTLSDFRLALQQLPEGGVQSPTDFYSVERLTKRFDKIMSGEYNLDYMPRPLYDKLKELVRMDKVRKMIR